MNDKNVIVGLDIGTTKVCTVVGLQTGKSKDSDIEIIGVGTHPSNGLKKGSVVNIDKTVKSIKSSLEEARLMSGINISKATNGKYNMLKWDRQEKRYYPLEIDEQ